MRKSRAHGLLDADARVIAFLNMQRVLGKERDQRVSEAYAVILPGTTVLSRQVPRNL